MTLSQIRRCAVFRTGSALLAVAAFVCGGCSAPEHASDPVESGPPRRVIWLVIDSLRADHLGMHGYERDTSPWLDEFAADSVSFDWALSPSNETLVSVAAYFTGQP